jgi:hypothetical protein
MLVCSVFSNICLNPEIHFPDVAEILESYPLIQPSSTVVFALLAALNMLLQA